MSQTRLNGLTIMYICKEETIVVDRNGKGQQSNQFDGPEGLIKNSKNYFRRQ
jgi:hypothetical protein